MKYLLPLPLIWILFACQADDSSSQFSEKAAQGAVLYQAHCSGCHGFDLEGGSASALRKTDWKYGSQRHHFRKNITYGISGVDMPPFGHMLSEPQIDQLVSYLKEAQSGPIASREIPTQVSSNAYELRIEQFIPDGLEVPWAVEFVDDTTLLVSERKGQLRWIKNGKLDPNPIAGTPTPHTGSTTGGFMDIALDPGYTQNGWVYLSYSHTDGASDDEQAAALTKIVRGKIDGHRWHSQETLFEAAPELRPVGGNRWGCRFLFDEAGHLYFTIGDMAQADDSQDPGKPTGKVFRIWPNGSIPKDNPFVNTSGALPAVFSIGNRNTQGLAIHPETGEIWSTDHGPMGGDEINILFKGANYGWPVITYGVDYSGEIVSELTQKAGMEQPVKYWTPSPAICDAEFCTSPLFPQWKNRLLVAALALEELKLLTLSDRRVVREELILKNIGRVREVKFGPDGKLYVVLNNPDKILRISPQFEM